MKKGYVIILTILIIVAAVLFGKEKIENNNLNKELSNLKSQVDESNQNKETYLKKQQELDKIKEENKEKIERYNEVEEWNKEIVKYLN